jgi:biotin carboxylase
LNMTQRALLYVDADQVAGGSYVYRAPHLAAAKSLGWQTIVLALRGSPNLEEIAGEADEVVEIDDFDTATISDAIARVAEQHMIVALMFFPNQCPPQGDIAQAIEHAAQRLGLPAVPAAALAACNNKFLMRQRLRGLASDAPPVAARLVGNSADIDVLPADFPFPVVAKPPFGAGSVLVKRCETRAALSAHYAHFVAAHSTSCLANNFGNSAHSFLDDAGAVYDYFPGRTMLVEECIEGIEGSAECVVYRGKVYTLAVQEKLLLTEGFSTVFEHQLITPPSSFSQAEIEAIRRHVTDCLLRLGLDNALAHVEFRLTPQGPRIIEVNPRLGGFYVNRVFSDLAGLDPYLLNLQILSGTLDPEALDCALQRAAGTADYHTMFVLYPPCSGYLLGVRGVEDALAMGGILTHWVTDISDYYDIDNEEKYVAKFWGAGASPRDAIDLYTRVSETIQIDMSSHAP